MLTPSSLERLRQKLNQKRYLEELAVLTGRPVQAEELAGLERTLTLRAAQQKFESQSAALSEIPFSDRRSERFKSFVQRLYEANPSPVYMWTSRTMDCGTLLVPSIRAIKWDFDFDVNEEGIVAFVTNDLANSLLLDFSTLPMSKRRLKIETQGMHWEGMVY